MNPIGTYVQVCRELTLEQFCERSPHPFLLHSAVSGSLVPTDATRGMTVDRLVLGDQSGARGQGIPAQEEAYTVFPLETRNPRAGPVSIGCSNTCDVQINDESVSTLHAHVERDGGAYLIKDNDSSAGTQVNDESIEPGASRELSSGDCVGFGYVDLTFLTPAEFYQFVRRFFGE